MKTKTPFIEVFVGLFLVFVFLLVSFLGAMMARSGVYGGSLFASVGGSVVFLLGLLGFMVAWETLRGSLKEPEC